MKTTVSLLWLGRDEGDDLKHDPRLEDLPGLDLEVTCALRKGTRVAEEVAGTALFKEDNSGSTPGTPPPLQAAPLFNHTP